MAAQTIHQLFNAACLCQLPMMKFNLFISVAVLASVISVPADAQRGRRGEQDAAYEATRQGSVRSLRSIENGVVPQMKARGSNYIGAEFDGQQARYRLKFLRDGAVIWVDVDGRSGAILGKAGE